MNSLVGRKDRRMGPLKGTRLTQGLTISGFHSQYFDTEGHQSLRLYLIAAVISRTVNEGTTVTNLAIKSVAASPIFRVKFACQYLKKGRVLLRPEKEEIKLDLGVECLAKAREVIVVEPSEPLAERYSKQLESGVFA